MVVGVDGTGDLAAARPYSAVYAVYAISSLDTEGTTCPVQSAKDP